MTTTDVTDPTVDADAVPASYEAATDELGDLIDAIESGGLNVDALAGAVRRGRFLITWCRNRVTATAAEIAAITADGADG